MGTKTTGRFSFVYKLALASVFAISSTLALATAPTALASSYSDSVSPSQQTRNQIDDIFNNIETTDSSTLDSSEAGRTALDSACQMGVNKLISSDMVPEFSFGYTGKFLPEEAAQYIKMKGRQLGQNAASSVCAALRGDSVVGVDLPQALQDAARSEILPMLMMVGQGVARGSGLPLLSRLEIQLGSSDGDIVSSITTVQPLWQDEADRHHVFTQLSYYHAPSELNDDGFRTQYDTVNAGIAYRYLTDDETKLYGINMFVDHSLDHNHNRMSVGVDARTSQLAFSANYYIPISDWKSLDLYYEEKAAGGWDVMLRGQVPELPSWTASVKAYEWDNQKNGKDLYGVTTALEYSPVPALAVRVGVRDESQDSASLEAGLRFNWRFDQPSELQWRPRTALAPVKDYVYSKVERENIIRVQTRRKASSLLTVIQTAGVNTSVDSNGTRALQVGQVLSMPATVTVANAVGAIARLHIGDGGYLTAGQDTQVRVEPNLITLLYGTMQYVSGSNIHNITVPGGTIVLHGTDIDVVSTAGDSSVRVRDGSITFTGTVSGAASLGVEDLAKSVSGVVGGSLAPSSPTYVAHTDDISVKIDRVAQRQEGEKVAPYPFEAPRIVTETLQVGEPLILGLRYNSAVAVTGNPILGISIGGHARTATYLSGSGSTDLHFEYIVQSSDIGQTSLTVTGMDKNGSTMTGNGKEAVTTIADTTLPFSGTIGDSVAPSGYAVAFTTDPISTLNVSAAAFNITSAEVGTTYDYTVSSSGGGTPVTGSGAVASSTQAVTGIDLSGLNDGTLTVSVTLTDSASNAGSAVTDTVVKDVNVPSGYSVAFTTDPITLGNVGAAAFAISSAEVGSTYNYTISSSGGGTPVTGSGTAATSSVNVTGINLSSVPDGTLTLSLTFTDPSGNTGVASTDTASKDASAPSGQAVAFTTAPVTNANKTAAAFNITSAEVGAAYNYAITSSGGGGVVSGSGTVASATQSVSGLNVSGLPDGMLTAAVTLTDTNGNTSAAVTGTVSKDTTAPSGYAVAFTTAPVNNGNKTAAAFNITSAELGATYAYTVTSSGGAGSVTGSGTIASATQSVSSVDLSSLPDGTLTVSVTLTDTASNAGSAVTGTTSKDTSSPSGYTVAFTTDPITGANVSSGAFTISSAEVGTSYAYSISGPSGAPVTGSGTIVGATKVVSGLNLSGLGDGTLTVSVVLTDTAGNAGTAATDTVSKDVTPPTGYAAAFVTSPINNTNQSAGAFNITSAEVGAAYAYVITSSGGGTSVTGSGTVSSATESITGLDLSGLGDGTLTVSVQLTDTNSNAGTTVTATTSKDTGTASGYGVVFTTSPISSANQTAAAFDLTLAEVGTTYDYTITSSGGAGSVTGSGTVASATQHVTGVDVSSLPDGTLTASVTLTDAVGNVGAAATDTVVKDAASPSGYAASFTTSPVNNGNKSAGAFSITSAEVGATYAYSISSSGGGTAVTGSGTVVGATQNVTGLNLSGLGDGTLTVSVTLTDTSANAGSAVTGTVSKDTAAPSGYAAAFTTSPVYSGNETAAAFNITSAEVGAGYAYTITSSGGAGSVTGSGTVASATQSVTGIDVSALPDGTLTVSVTLTDTAGNAGSAVTGTVLKDSTPSIGYGVAFTTSPVNNGNKSATAFNITSAEVGAGYAYTITSSGGAGSVTGSGTVSSATQAVTGIDVSSLPDGTLTASVVLTDTHGNAGSAATGTVSKDATLPTGYAVVFTTDPVVTGNVTAGAISITSAEVGTTYNYSITSTGGGTAVTGSGTVVAATQNATGINLSGLGDGTLTVSVTLTDSSSNAGSAVTDTVVKDLTAPSGYNVAFTTSPVNNANKAASAFSITTAEVGSTYNYTITSSGGAGSVTGSGTVASATQAVTGVDVSSLPDGTLTVTVALTDTYGNTGSGSTGTVTKDVAAPSGYTTVFTTDPVNLSNYTAAAFDIATAEVGSTYNYTITTSGGAGTVSGSGTVSAATHSVTALDLTSVQDGTLTVSVTLTDTHGNLGSATTDTVVKDIIAPTITSVTPPADGTYEP